MENLYNYDLPTLEQFFIELEQKKYRAQQVFEWLYRHRVENFTEMTNLSIKTVNVLQEHFCLKNLTLVDLHTANDGTKKYLFRLEDNHLIETVLMRHSYGNSVCVTSQVGCKMQCSFCASGELGFIRNLTHAEMVLQILYIQKELDKTNERVTNVVVMGIGEPFDNFDTLVSFLQTINYAKGFEIGARHITVSTSGLVPKIKDFANVKLQINLAISLHAPNDQLRNTLMKVNKVYPIKELLQAVDEYIIKTNRRVTFEYILLKGVNDSINCAFELARLLKGINCYVNLIPYNPVKSNQYERTSKERAHQFFEVLRQNRINATLRVEHGNGIDAACGQLRAKITNDSNQVLANKKSGK